MEIVAQLLQTKELTLPFFDLPEAELAKAYAPGKWTVREILVHLADAESVLHERIKRAIAEPRPLIMAFDQDLWSQKLHYPSFPLGISKALFLANRNSVIYLAEQFYESLGSNEFVHSYTGVRSLKDEIDKVVWHNQGHLEQIFTALKSN